MKRVGRLWSLITTPENIHQAFNKAAKGRRQRSAVQRAEVQRDILEPQLLHDLTVGAYTTSEYKLRTIYEPKVRQIYILPFWPDRVAQHAVMNVVAPHMDKWMIHHSYACRKGKGQHACSRQTMNFIRRYKYVLQCDVSKFYPSVDHTILLQQLQARFKDLRLLSYFEEVIRSSDSVPGALKGKNIPIGNLVSPWLGNLYLTEFDNWVLSHGGVGYIRYCDDFLVFSDSKTKLHSLASTISNYLQDRLLLCLSKTEVYPVSNGVDFVGYRHFPDYVLLRKRLVRRMRKVTGRIAAGGASDPHRVLSSVVSYRGWCRWANSHNFLTHLNFDRVEAYARLRCA